MILKKLAGLFILLIISCSKKVERDVISVPAKSELKILEAQTNFPISGATVNLQKCTKPDWVFGCTAYITIATYSTGITGTYSFPSSLIVDRIIVTHPKYWPARSDRLTHISLNPDAWAKVNLNNVNSYPPGYKVRVGKIFYSPYYSGNKVTVDANVDTTIYVRCFGLSENMISWQILNNVGTTTPVEGTTASIYINKFDTVTVTIDY